MPVTQPLERSANPSSLSSVPVPHPLLAGTHKEPESERHLPRTVMQYLLLSLGNASDTLVVGVPIDESLKRDKVSAATKEEGDAAVTLGDFLSSVTATGLGGNKDTRKCARQQRLARKHASHTLHERLCISPMCFVFSGRRRRTA